MNLNTYHVVKVVGGVRMVEVTNLTKEFKKVKAVDHINFSVKKGEILGLLGEKAERHNS